jgi:hypothetical protein
LFLSEEAAVTISDSKLQQNQYEGLEGLAGESINLY